VAVVQAHLGAEGAGGDVGRDVRVHGSDALADARRVLVVPGGLDQQPAGVARAGLGDVAAVALLAGGVLRRRQAEEAHQLARGGEAAQVAELGEQPERGDRGDAAKTAQPAHRVAPRLTRGDVVELVVERGELRVEAVEVGEHVLQRRLSERIAEALAADPRLVGLGPLFLPSRKTWPWRSSCLATRWRAARRAQTRSSRQRTRSRSPSWASVG